MKQKIFWLVVVVMMSISSCSVPKHEGVVKVDGVSECVSAVDDVVVWLSGNSNQASDVYPGVGNTFPGSRSGMVGDGYNFNGISMITINDSASLRQESEQGLSFDFWIKPDFLGTTRILFAKIHDINWISYGLFLLPDGRLSWTVQNKDTDSWPRWISIVRLPKERFSHVAITYKKEWINASDGAIFIDGKQDQVSFEVRNYTKSFRIKYDSTPLFIGNAPDEYKPRSFRGVIDEFRFSSGVLQPNEVKSIADARSLGVCKPVQP
ncbi:MAG: LamG domain-containing protein [Nanoarchaeota archaeon]